MIILACCQFLNTPNSSNWTAVPPYLRCQETILYHRQDRKLQAAEGVAEVMVRGRMSLHPPASIHDILLP